jgi:ABC-type multidrug transport system ATPase subunit
LNNKPILLSAKGIYYQHPSGKTRILQISNLTIAEDQCVLIIGANGAGKSSLISFLAGYTHIAGADVYWKGNRIKPTHQRLVPGFENMAFVPQTPILDPFLSVKEQLLRWSRSYPDHLADAWMGSSIKLFGLKPILDQKVGDLSGGEKRRLALSKSRLGKPELILLDEPFSDLDVLGKRELCQMLYSIRQEWKPTMLLVSHEALDIQWLADEIWTLDKGRCIEKVIRSNSEFNVRHHKTAILMGYKNLFPAKAKIIFQETIEIPSQFRFFQLPPEAVLEHPNDGKVDMVSIGRWALMSQWRSEGQWKSIWMSSGNHLTIEVWLPFLTTTEEKLFWVSEKDIQFFF